MNTYITACGYSQNPFTEELEPRIFVTRSTLRWTLIYWVTDLLCYYADHRWCDSRLIVWLREKALQHEEDFEFAVTDETINRYSVWRGWTTWDDLLDDDEDDDEYVS